MSAAAAAPGTRGATNRAATGVTAPRPSGAGEPLRIVIASAFYSEGMGYSENCLSRALARLGHDVHVVTSTYNVYANEPLYDATYREFLGPPQVAPGSYRSDGYKVHRLPASLVGGYVRLRRIGHTVRSLHPDVVHSLEVGSVLTWELALAAVGSDFRLFAETHQTMSVMRPYMLDSDGDRARRAVYRLTRTLPTWLASHAVERCFAVTPDCGEVARRFYGVPASKIALLSLGADTETFHPVETEEERAARDELRASLGVAVDDIVCMYTGRFTHDKNPLVLARAIDSLAAVDPRFKGVFIGDGVQKAALASCRNVRVLPFMNHRNLAAHYRAADIGVWPRQESMSMIDAASSGLPIVVSDRLGESDRVSGNGRTYAENDEASLAGVLRSLGDPAERARLGATGRRKMLRGFNWTKFAEVVERAFRESLGRPCAE